MSKLTVLYNIVKKAKETKACQGAAEAEFKLDDILLGTVSARFDCSDDRCEKTVQARFGEETLNVEHRGKGCCPQEGLPHGHFHGQGHGHRRCCSGSPLDKALFMLKVLDRLELEEPDNGLKVLTLTLKAEDLPDAVLQKLQGCCTEHPCCHSDAMARRLEACGFASADLSNLTPGSLSLRLLVKADYSVQELSLVVNGTVADSTAPAGRALTATLTASHR